MPRAGPWLSQWKCAFREFSVPRDNLGGILGIDPRSFDRSMLKEEKGGSEVGDVDQDVGGKVNLAKSESMVKGGI